MSTDTLTRPAEKSTALAKSGNDIRSFLAGDKFKEQVALALPKHMTPDRFARVALTALTKTPKLLDCTRESLLSCLMTCSQLGLEPDGIHAFLIPYKTDCTLIIGYRGLINLARRSGDVAVFRAELVKEEDEFEWNNGTVTHWIDWRRPRGKPQCVYSYVRFRDGTEDWEVLTLDECLAIRDRSQGYRAAVQYNKSHPWLSDESEMLKKTAIRRHSKRLTLSPEFMEALDKDDDRLEDIRNVTPLPLKAPRLLQSTPPAAPPDAPPVADNHAGAAAEFWKKCSAREFDLRTVNAWLVKHGHLADTTESLTDAEAAKIVWEDFEPDMF